MNVDIKTLLLKSLSANKIIRGSHRLYFGKSCFIIKYEVKGKFLSITNLKKTFKKHESCHQCLQRSYRLIQLYQLKVKNYLRNKLDLADGDRKKGSLNISETIKLNIDGVIVLTKAIQTVEFETTPKPSSAATQSQDKQLITLTQQTITSTIGYNFINLSGRHSLLPNSITNKVSKSCQTEFNRETRGIQCKRRTLAAATQTDVVTVNSSYTQICDEPNSGDNLEKSNQTLETNTTALGHMVEKDVVVYMLNEIGEMVLNQNQILNSNTQLLGQISEMTMLTKRLTLGKAWRKRRSKQKKNPPINCNNQQSFDNQKIKRSSTKEIFGHKSTQTEQIIQPDKCTQTTNDFNKPRTLSFLRKRR